MNELVVMVVTALSQPDQGPSHLFDPPRCQGFLLSEGQIHKISRILKVGAI